MNIIQRILQLENDIRELRLSRLPELTGAARSGRRPVNRILLEVSNTLMRAQRISIKLPIHFNEYNE